MEDLYGGTFIRFSKAQQKGLELIKQRGGLTVASIIVMVYSLVPHQSRKLRLCFWTSGLSLY